MLEIEDINNFLNNNNYDLRISGNARWIDQKCTPDVIWSISDFVLEYTESISETFTARDIWNSVYAMQTIAETFSKPGTSEKAAENEYDKVFSQPLCMLNYAGVIEDISPKPNRHLYKVVNKEILSYIARNDMYSLRFLCAYIEKVLSDSDLIKTFNSFFNNQDTAHFEQLKKTFINFYHMYTPVKKEYEPKRIFSKVLNPLAYQKKKLGTIRGRLSKDIIKKSDMMYNRDNFRDVYENKPKGVTRKEWLKDHPEIERRDGYFEQMMIRAKKTLRENILYSRNGLSELTQFSDEHNDMERASQMHHIFPKNEYPDIKHYLENLIALTPNQHYGYAHPNNNTQVVDLAAQKVLLIAKTKSIQENSLNPNEESIYEFKNLLFVLSTGWDNEDVLEIEKDDYMDVIHAINYHY